MSNPTERAIFLQAIEEESLEDRNAFLASACGDDDALRASLETLLAAHDKPAALLDHPIGADGNRPSLPPLGWGEPVDHIGMQFGSYKLMELIGEGGFGLVFVAEQEEPIRRRVALKIVKPGLGSKSVIARFEAERQAVAMMNHPNIAQVFDAGVTPDGRPYFVMELVRGLPITEFCDKQRLSIRQRLELMVDVCSAVHHAHQKGIIHRDLKPSNVMVTLHDGKPVAKVIDFGVAKALTEKLTDKTVYTSILSMIGTPLYMSPEQAELSGLDVDTRSDIFSLGVILYELLIGETPFDRARFDTAGLDELRRIIREEEPPRPSTRLSTCNEAQTTAADVRRVEPRRLASALQGDLDWIVMKSLEKDRSRRYDSAASFAEDIGNYLASEPIKARPPSAIYRLKKFARRHRAAFVTAALVGITMIAGTAASLWQMSKAIGERDAKDRALQQATQARAETTDAKLKVEQFAERQFRANEFVFNGQAHADAGRWMDAAREYDAAVAIQPDYYLPRVQRAQLFANLGLWPEAADDYEIAIEGSVETSQPQWWGFAGLSVYAARDDAFRQIAEKRRSEILKDPSIAQWMLLRDLAVSEQALSPGEFQEFLEMAKSWLSERERKSSESRRPPPPSRSGRPPRPRRFDPLSRASSTDTTPGCICEYITGMLHLRAGDPDAAENMFWSAAEDPRWPSSFLVDAPMAMVHFRRGNVEKAKESLRRSDANIGKRVASLIDRPRRSPGSPWFDLVEGLQINREASHVINRSPSTLEAQVDQRRKASLKLLEGQQP